MSGTSEEKTASHTPGPWEIPPNPHGDDTRRFIWPEPTGDFVAGECRDTGFCIAVVSPRADVAVLEANARLIAAAPDLLQALKAIAENDPGMRPRDWLATAHAVIAKAEGRS